MARMWHFDVMKLYVQPTAEILKSEKNKENAVFCFLCLDLDVEDNFMKILQFLKIKNLSLKCLCPLPVNITEKFYKSFHLWHIFWQAPEGSIALILK